MFNWNDLESFLTLTRAGKLNIASKKLKIESTTISRRISRLEKKLSSKLFFRSNNLYILTDYGKKLLSYAEKIESEVIQISEKFTNKNISPTGAVRIAVPEGFGVEIFSKHLKEFYSLYPELEIELLADSKSRNLLNREIDISIALSRPNKGNLISWKLADYKLNLYATEKYLIRNKSIKKIDDLDGHSFISFVDDLVEFPELKYIDELKKNIKIIFKSNNLNAQINAVEQGIGLALLHNFMTRNKTKLIKVLPEEINIYREYWVVVHEKLYQLERIKIVLNFLKKIIKKEKINLLNN